jgi:hypothetical protein
MFVWNGESRLTAATADPLDVWSVTGSNFKYSNAYLIRRMEEKRLDSFKKLAEFRAWHNRQGDFWWPTE